MIIAFIATSNFQLKFFSFSIKLWKLDQTLSTHYSLDENNPGQNSLPMQIISAKKFETLMNDTIIYESGIHSMIYRAFKFPSDKVFSYLVIVSWIHEWFLCDVKKFFFIVFFFLLFTLHLSTSLSFASRFRSHLKIFYRPFPFSSYCFNLSTVISDIHLISYARSSSFNKNICLLFNDAFGTTAFCQEFRSRSSSLNVVQV